MRYIKSFRMSPFTKVINGYGVKYAELSSHQNKYFCCPHEIHAPKYYRREYLLAPYVAWFCCSSIYIPLWSLIPIQIRFKEMLLSYKQKEWEWHWFKIINIRMSYKGKVYVHILPLCCMILWVCCILSIYLKVSTKQSKLDSVCYGMATII